MTIPIVKTGFSMHWKNHLLRGVFACTASVLCWQPPSAVAEPAAPAAPYAVQSAEDIENRLNLDERKLMQEGLTWSGVYTGSIDGNFAGDTRDAITALQQQYQQPGTGLISTKMAVHLQQVSEKARAKFGWQTVTDSFTGVTLAYPTQLLMATRNPRTNFLTLKSDDNSISLQILNTVSVAPGAIDRLYAKLHKETAPSLTYTLKKEDMFIVAWERGARKYYSRYQQRGNEIRGYELIWASDRDTEMQIVSALISNSFEPFDAPRRIKFPDYAYLTNLSTETRKEARKSQSSGGKTSAIKQQTQATATFDGLGPRFSYAYEELRAVAEIDAYRLTRKSDLLAGNVEIDALDGTFMMHRPLRYIATQCGVKEAYYSREDTAIFLCYRTVDYLLRQADELNTHNDPAFRTDYVKARLPLILLHATAHALIDVLNLPPPVDEEEAVNQLVATLILLDVNNKQTLERLTHMLTMTAAGFRTKDLPQYPYRDASSKEHALNEQRYENLLCMIYGSHPQRYASIVDQGLLPKSRAEQCPEQASKIIPAWTRLLLPHIAPRYSQQVSDSINRQEAQTQQ